MSDRFPPDWFLRQNPWAPWMPNTTPNAAPTSPATAPASPVPPTSTSNQDGSLSFHHGGFNWVETPNGGLLAVHPNGEGVEWVETPSGGLLAYPKRQVPPAWPPSAFPEHLDSARYWGAAPSPELPKPPALQPTSTSADRLTGAGDQAIPLWGNTPGTFSWTESPDGRLPAGSAPPIDPASLQAGMPFDANVESLATSTLPNEQTWDNPRPQELSYWEAAPSRVSAEPMPGSNDHLSPVPRAPSWDSVPARAAASASEQWTAPWTVSGFGLRSPAMPFLGAEEAAPSVVPHGSPSQPQGNYVGNKVSDGPDIEPAEQAQQRQNTLSPQEIENICKLDPAQVAANVLNQWLPGVGQVDPTTGQVRTLDWVRQQAYQMQKMIEQLQRELRCASV